MIMARPKKLRSGAWGAIVEGKVTTGQEVKIVTKAGKSWIARVERIVWSGDGVTIVATESRKRRSSCGCTGYCCERRCMCGPECSCRGGPIFDC